MGVLLASKNKFAAAEYVFEVTHVGAGSSTGITDVEALRTRQLANAFRIEHTYPGGAPGSTVIRVQRTDPTFGFAAIEINGLLLAILGIECQEPTVTHFECHVTARDIAGDALAGSNSYVVYPVSAERGLGEACATWIDDVSALDCYMLDFEIKPVIPGGVGVAFIIDVGAVWLTEYFETTFPIAEGWKEGQAEAGTTGFSRGRQGYGDSEVVYRTLDFGLRRMSEDEKEAFKRFFASTGLSRPMLFATRIAGSDTLHKTPGLMYCSISSPPQIRRQGGWMFMADLQITEEF